MPLATVGRRAMEDASKLLAPDSPRTVTVITVDSSDSSTDIYDRKPV